MNRTMTSETDDAAVRAMLRNGIDVEERKWGRAHAQRELRDIGLPDLRTFADRIKFYKTILSAPAYEGWASEWQRIWDENGGLTA